MNLQKGFSLIELMIIVAIIGILAMMAIPLYNDYILRVKITQAIHETVPLQNRMVDTYLNEGMQGIQNMHYDSNYNYVWDEYEFNSDVVESVNPHYASGRESGVYFGYIITIKSKDIGLEAAISAKSPWGGSTVYRRIGVIYAAENAEIVTDPKASYPANPSQMTQATILKGPYCGQLNTSPGESISSDVPRKFLPIACRNSGTRAPYDGRLTLDGAIDFDDLFK